MEVFVAAIDDQNGNIYMETFTYRATESLLADVHLSKSRNKVIDTDVS